MAARRTTAQSLATRARIVLASSAGAQNKAIAVDLGVDQATVGKWRRRFTLRGLDGLYDEPKPGAPRTISDAEVEAVIFGLQPHRAETFKLSTDPLFIDKVRDVVGLYLAPPERAVVLCVDEKTQVQALDRSQPVLPLRPGQVERRTHDYKRHGTTALFAALNTATGSVIGKCYARHRAVEFKRFLNEIERNVPDDHDIHIIMDNYATHKTPAIRAWFARRPRWHVHFTPTGASWLNMVERFFAADHRATDPPRRAHQRQAARRRDPRLHRTARHRPASVHMGPHRRRDPRRRRPLPPQDRA